MPIEEKQFYEYITLSGKSTVTLDNYKESPATAFLKFVINAKNASNQCIRTFKAPRRKKYTTQSLSNIQIINAGLLASIMGNFETFQKYLFAQAFECSIYLNKFNVKAFIKDIEENLKHDINIDVERFSAYRDNPTAVGLILADSLKNWQAPTVVNKYFSAFRLKDNTGKARCFYSNDTEKSLAILWQMRHSIVHTASTITIPDSQKIEQLNSFAGKEIVLDPQFITQVARKFHPLIKACVENLKMVYIPNIKQGLPLSVSNRISKLFEVKSSCSVWLK